MYLVDRPSGRPAAHHDLEPAFQALVERHRSGDPSALNALMTEIYPSIHRIVFRLAGLRDRDTHEDLVQASLEQVCRSIDAFEGRSRFTTFVFGICHRVVARARRYDRVRSWFRRDAEAVCIPQEQPSNAAPDERYDHEVQLVAARNALSALQGEERTAFVLHEIEELPLEEVAAALSCSTRTVKRRLRAAREKLLASRGDVS
jgi:RNA polymerase sigma-70 factor, ECF subfamily